jgi:outer membrane immunogenic protein
VIRTLLLSTVALATVAGSAFAADLPSRRAPPVYAPPPPIPVFTWTGFYVGGQVGYEFGRSSATATFAPTGAFLAGNSSSKDGVIGGGHVGYLWSTQSLPVLGGFFGGGFGTGGVIGIEGDVDGTSARAAYGLPLVTNYASDRIQGSIRGRLGVAFDRVLVYATGGAAFGDLRNTYVSTIGLGSEAYDHTRVGYTVGGGVEYAFTNNFSVRVEYRYTDFGTFTDNLTTTTAGLENVTHRETDNRVQAGFSYKFDTFTPAAPVVARF